MFLGPFLLSYRGQGNIRVSRCLRAFFQKSSRLHIRPMTCRKVMKVEMRDVIDENLMKNVVAPKHCGMS